MTTNLKPLIFDLQVLSGAKILGKQQISLLHDKRSVVEFAIATTEFEECAKNIHTRSLIIEIVSNFDDEREMNEVGYFLARTFATAAIVSLDFLIDTHPLCTHYGEFIEMHRMMIEKYKQQLSSLYVYRNGDIYEYRSEENDEKRYVRFEDHVQEKFKGRWRPVPKDRAKRSQLHQNYLNASRDPNFDIDKFWDDYVWSQVKLNIQKSLDESSTESIVTPSFVDNTGADLRKHKRPNDGKITRQLILKQADCFVCYSNKDCAFVMQEPEYIFEAPQDTQQQKKTTIYDIKLRITFRKLSELVCHR